MKLFKKPVKDDLLDESDVVQKKSFNLSKKALIPIGVVVVLVVVLIVKSLVGGKSELEYYDTFEKVFSAELGYFKYTLDVRTGEKGSLITDSTKANVSMEELKNSANVEDEVEGETEEVEDSTEDFQSKNEFQDWGKYADIKSGDWQYPNYRIIIEGNTTSIEPLKTNFTVSIATDAYNNKFTEVYCIDGNYYLDVESICDWLKNSGDSYLVGVGDTLSFGSKWYVIPEAEFLVASRYAEVGEQELSQCDGLTKLYRRFLVALNTTKSTIKGSIGTTGQIVSGDIVTLNLDGVDATSVVSAFKSMSVRSGDFYDSLIETGKSKELYDDSQYKQAMREKDNFIEAMSELATYLQVTDLSTLNTKIGGNARVYTNGYGNQQIEVGLAVNYSSDKDVMLQINGVRSGDNNEITLPNGSQIKEKSGVYRDVLDKVFDYLNFTKIKTDVKLEINPSTISDEILTRFINLVNETGTAGYYITKNNVYGFIDKYSDYKPTESTTKDDDVNAKLVSDLAEALNDIVGGIVVEKEVEKEEVVEQYPHITVKKSGVVFDIDYVQEESDSKIMKLKVEVLNKSDSDYTFNVTDFSMRTLLNSIYPANNETLLRDADNTFSMDQLIDEITLVPHEWSEFTMYFVMSDDDGHMDLYFGDENFGSIIEY